MTAKQYLKQAQNINTLIEDDLLELKALRATINSVSSIDYSRDIVQSTPTNRIENCIVKIVDLESKINNHIVKYIDLKEEIRNKIMQLKDETEIMILKYRYILFLSWKVVAKKLEFSLSQVQHVHRKALSSITLIL